MTTSTPHGLSPSEIAFLCEMELVTVLPRQRLESLKLLGGTTPALRPPHRTALPLWLALLLKRQRRADIVPPPWLHAPALSQMLEKEINDPQPGSFNPAPPLNSNATPPFQPSSLADGPADALPYHWLEMGQLLLAEASDDIVDAEAVRRLLRDLREVRMSKLRAVFGDKDKGVNSNKASAAGTELKSGGGIKLDGIGAMEVGETRAFIGGVVDGLRKIGASRETAEKERAEEEAERGGFGDGGEDDDDEDMVM